MGDSLPMARRSIKSGALLLCSSSGPPPVYLRISPKADTPYSSTLAVNIMKAVAIKEARRNTLPCRNYREAWCTLEAVLE